MLALEFYEEVQVTIVQVHLVAAGVVAGVAGDKYNFTLTNDP